MIMLDWILLHSTSLPASLYMDSDHPGPRENYLDGGRGGEGERREEANSVSG